MKSINLAVACSLLILFSCTSTRKAMDSWIGDTKQNLILKLGPPERTASDGGTGEILVYSKQRYNPVATVTMYYLYFFYSNSDGKIYHWRSEQGTVPPQNINMKLYIR